MSLRWRLAVVAAVLGALLPILAGGPASAAPTISNFTPTTGGAGTLVTINGSNFIAGSTVMLSGKPANVSSITATAIKFTVPASATTGQIKVTDSSGSVTAPGTFTVTAQICCTRTVSPTASFPVYGTALEPSKTFRLSLYKQGEFVTNLATATTDPAGGFNLASVALPPEVTPGTYDLVASTEEKAASVTVVVQAQWQAVSATARGRSAQRFESIIGYHNVADLDLDWVHSISSVFHRPLVVSGLVIVRSGTDVAAISATTGAKAWRVTVGGDSFDAITSAGSSVFASTGTAVRALAVSNGATQWTSSCSACPTDTIFDNVAAADGIVVATTGGTIRAFNAANGAYLWTGTPPTSHPYSDVVPTILPGTVIVRSFSAPSYVAAYDAATGGFLWQSQLSNSRWVVPASTIPALAGAIFVTNSAGSPAALSINAGALWTRSDITNVNLGSHAVGHGLALYSNSATLYALSSADGSTRWTLPGYCTGSTYANGIFYAACTDGIRAIEAGSGELIAKLGVASNSYLEAPVPAGGSLYLPTSRGVVALNLAAANR